MPDIGIDILTEVSMNSTMWAAVTGSCGLDIWVETVLNTENRVRVAVSRETLTGKIIAVVSGVGAIAEVGANTLAAVISVSEYTPMPVS